MSEQAKFWRCVKAYEHPLVADRILGAIYREGHAYADDVVVRPVAFPELMQLWTPQPGDWVTREDDSVKHEYAVVVVDGELVGIDLDGKPCVTEHIKALAPVLHRAPSLPAQATPDDVFRVGDEVEFIGNEDSWGALKNAVVLAKIISVEDNGWYRWAAHDRKYRNSTHEGCWRSQKNDLRKLSGGSPRAEAATEAPKGGDRELPHSSHAPSPAAALPSYIGASARWDKAQEERRQKAIAIQKQLVSDAAHDFETDEDGTGRNARGYVEDAVKEAKTLLARVAIKPTKPRRAMRPGWLDCGVNCRGW